MLVGSAALLQQQHMLLLQQQHMLLLQQQHMLLLQQQQMLYPAMQNVALSLPSHVFCDAKASSEAHLKL